METHTAEGLGGAATTNPREKKTEKQPLFHVEKHNGTRYLIANIDNPKVIAQSGIIELEVIKKKNTSEAHFTTGNSYNPDTGVYFGKILGVNAKTKEVIWHRVAVGDRKLYDLSKKADRLDCSVMMNSAVVIGSPFQKGRPLFKIHDSEAEAKAYIAERSIRRKVDEILDQNIPIEEMMDIYRCFGKNPQGFTPNRLHSELLKQADRSPKKFYDIWHSQNRAALIIFNRCLAVGAITQNALQGYMWKNLAIGFTEEAAVAYLSKNPTVLHQADTESQQKDSFRATLKPKTAAEIKFLTEGLDNEDDEELLNLRAEAGMMKIPGSNTMSKAQLEKAIEEASEGG